MASIALTANNSSLRYQQLPITQRIQYIFDRYASDEILVTSSFGTSAAILLHLIQQIAPGHPIHFLNTGYLFRETITYKEYLTSLWDLNVVEKDPEPFRHFKTGHLQTWANEPNECCSINKVDVLKPLLWKHKVWISGLMSHQSGFRKSLGMIEYNDPLTRFFPILDLKHDDIMAYQLKHSIPIHPLSKRGFGSVGCTHCTVAGEKRTGRWSGQAKTECGLHRV